MPGRVPPIPGMNDNSASVYPVIPGRLEANAGTNGTKPGTNVVFLYESAGRVGTAQGQWWDDLHKARDEIHGWLNSFSLPPRSFLCTSSDSEDPKRRNRGGNEEALNQKGHLIC